MKPCFSKTWDSEADVVVIGYGGAGAVTAITAFDAGAHVVVLEKTQSLAGLGIKPDRRRSTRISGGGGNTHISMGTVSSPANVADAVDYLFSACGGQTPLDVCTAWAEEVCGNEAWFRQMGIKGTIVEDSPREYDSLPGASAMNIFRVKGWGPALFERLDQLVRQRGIKVLFHMPGEELIQDHETREILGVKARHRKKTIHIKARKAVVLCTGGFEFNEEMKNNFLKCWPMKFYGWQYNTGDGIKMAQKVGADLWHMDVIAGGNCSWFDDPAYDFGISTSTKTDNYIWVDKFGRRFCDEPKAWHPHGGWVVHLERNPGYPGFSRVPSYLVFDETAMRAGPIGADEAVKKGGFHMGRRLLPAELGGYEGWSEDNIKELKRGWIRKGDSVAALAAAIGGEMDAGLLKKAWRPITNAARRERTLSSAGPRRRCSLWTVLLFTRCPFTRGWSVPVEGPGEVPGLRCWTLMESRFPDCLLPGTAAPSMGGPTAWAAAIWGRRVRSAASPEEMRPGCGPGISSPNHIFRGKNEPKESSGNVGGCGGYRRFRRGIARGREGCRGGCEKGHSS